MKAYESVKCMVSPKAAKVIGVDSNTCLTNHDAMNGLKEKPKGVMNQLDHLDRTDVAMDRMKIKIDAEDEAVKTYYMSHSPTNINQTENACETIKS